MKKIAGLCAILTLLATQASAFYVVVLKDGTTYKAKSKWTVVNGKAMVQLEAGGTLQLDPSLIDLAKSEQQTKMGLANGKVLEVSQDAQAAPQTKTVSLGQGVKLRNIGGPAAQQPAAAPAQPQPTAPVAAAPTTTRVAAPPPPPATGAGRLDPEVIAKFDRAFENVGIYEKKLEGKGAGILRADLTADSEEKVFNAISAASFLMVRNAGVAGTKLEIVEIFMRTTNGGSAGRFQMTRADAEAIDQKKITQQEYFVRKVIY